MPDKPPRRLSFGTAAELYEEIRPGYPADLVTEVLEHCGGTGALAVEAGAGTGKATRAFAERGLRIVAVEPDPAMAGILAASCAAYPNVTVVGTMRDLGVGLVPYSPLGRGFLTATLDVTALGERDFRSRNPRFAGDANQAIADAVREVAEAKGVAPAQLALAWVYAQAGRLGVPVVPIPGTKRVKWLEQNVAALDITLTADELAALEPLAGQVAGGRY